MANIGFLPGRGSVCRLRSPKISFKLAIYLYQSASNRGKQERPHTPLRGHLQKIALAASIALFPSYISTKGNQEFAS